MLPSISPHTAVEREKESKEALTQQKRKITRQWEVLNRLKKRWVAPAHWLVQYCLAGLEAAVIDLQCRVNCT